MQRIASLTSPEQAEDALIRAIRDLPVLRRAILSYLKGPDAEKGRSLATGLREISGWLPERSAVEIGELAQLLSEGIPLNDSTANDLLNVIDPHVFNDIWRAGYESDRIVDVHLKRGGKHSKRAMEIVYSQTPQTREKAMEGRLHALKEFIYRHPGLFKSQLAAMAAERSIVDTSESRIQDYIDILAERGDILTVGGPQGNYRFCFPHPARVGDRRAFYGRTFPVHGKIKVIQKEVGYFHSLRRFFRFGIVNSGMRDIGVLFPAGAIKDDDDPINGFGNLFPIEATVPSGSVREFDTGGIDECVLPRVIEETRTASGELLRWVDPEFLKSLSNPDPIRSGDSAPR